MKTSIFCGGSGKRFWPLSRRKRPKQLLPLFDGRSTLQVTFDRLTPVVPPGDIFISTIFPYFKEIKRQLPKLPKENLIGEPALRDLGPAVALNAAITAKVASPDEPFAILWSDHILKHEKRFRGMLKMAEEIISAGEKQIVFFGCAPRFANENLGWIGLDGKPNEREEVSRLGLLSFKYRPEKKEAEKFFKSGQYTWNLGYWVSTPRYILSAFKEHEPDIYHAVTDIVRIWGKSNYREVLEELYPKLEKISFDDAVIEKLDFSDATVLVADLGWADIGNPYAFKESVCGDKNLFMGEVIDSGSEDSFVYNNSGQLVTTIGLEGMVVIATKDAFLVCGKDKAKEIKRIVESLGEKGRTDLI